MSILPHQLAIEIDFATAVFRPLNTDQVPVNLTPVAVIRPFVGLARSEMKRARNLLVEKNVTHRFLDVWIETEREFADIAGALV
jgi:hypothetical protein